MLRDIAPLDPERHGVWVVELRVRALVGEAACVYALTGSLGNARRLVGEALAVATAAGEPRLEALAHGQEGLLHVRSGNAGAALDAFDRALRSVEPSNHRDLAVLHINRAAAALEIGDLAAAVRSNESALAHAQAGQYDRYAAFAQLNLGLARYREGDFPAALRELEAAAARQPGGPDGWSEVSRAQILLDAGLVSEAEQVLADAADLFVTDDLTGERADALYGRAQCALLLRRFDDAMRWAAQAARAFTRVGNSVWALRATVVRLEGRLADDRERAGLSRSTLRRRAERALRLADDGEAHGPGTGRDVAVAARLLAVEWALLAGDVARAVEIARAVPRRLSSDSPLPLRVHHRSVLAQVAFAQGDRRAGLRAVRGGHQILADHRARVGSVDAVTAAAAHGGRLARVDVEAAMATGRASAVFDATERGRAAFAGAARVRPPNDPGLAELLVQARRAGEDARELAAGPEADDRTRSAQRAAESYRLQEQARRRSWQLSGSAGSLVPRPATAAATVDRLRRAGTEEVVVSYLLTERITALRADGTGVRSVNLCPAAELLELVRRVRGDTEVLANGLIPPRMRDVAAASARRSLARIDDLLLAPLEVSGALYVAARGDLLGVPWAAMPSRAGRATSVNSWVDLSSIGPAPAPPRVVVVAGPDLAAAEEEARLVADVWDDALLLAGPDATCGRTGAALEGATVVHLGAHGRHEPDNPLFSAVRLADGSLYAHELDGTDLSGAVVVLSACEVGRASTRVGGEPLGLTSVLLRLGARAVVAAVAPLRDDVAVRVMPRLHASLREGLEPAAALAHALADEVEPVPLVCFGPMPLVSP
ncbi:CHAT domain-containing protein [Isoptericola sp. CG 20/1183]|uniref:CHAT domain-containing protein n=1 Tax=Isoptericola halotolerans TaxID=300560 RepID=A0ABX5EGY7_9MICO|nr:MULTISPECIES: CHAT domain-containing protein [Isoptericola]PRZ07080.1 CHAT domain-containing protein [Isoptericola halotolerans]PRZ07248.1 CHAT domain-containing protein [Isoptericola sp. CG 20/1183]